MTKEKPLIEVQGVAKRFCRNLKRSLFYGMCDIGGELLCRGGDQHHLRPEEFWALNDVNVTVRRGECLALLGRNGAGKTTLLRVINGLIKPDRGSVSLRGRVGALIALGAGFNPILTGRENVYINAAVLGIRRREVDERLDEIIDFAAMREFIDMPVQSYSSGMQVRLGFAVATAMQPDVLLVDEVLAVGDIGFRLRCLRRIGEIMKDTAVVFVSHDLPQVARICNRVLVLKSGGVAFYGDTHRGLEVYSDLAEDTGKVSQNLTLAPIIREFQVGPEDITIATGESVELRLEFDSSVETRPGLCLFALYAHESAHAQAEFTEHLPLIPAGSSKFVFRMGPLHLRRGKYWLAVTITDESRKSTIVHGVNLLPITIEGNLGYGVSYQVPVEGVARGEEKRAGAPRR